VPAAGGPTAELELRVERTLGGFARARGVAPRFEFEPPARMARRVTAPSGKGTDGNPDAGALGFRLPWREDASGDATAFTLAWLETAAHGALTLVETTRQGTLAAFVWASADEAQRLHG